MWFFFFFFKQKTAYEMRISDWSSDVCSSDLVARRHAHAVDRIDELGERGGGFHQEGGAIILGRLDLARRFDRGLTAAERRGLHHRRRFLDRHRQLALGDRGGSDRKSTRLNSSH